MFKDQKKIEINVRKIDILDSHKIRADVIKLDLQGYELEVLGSENSLNIVNLPSSNLMFVF